MPQFNIVNEDEPTSQKLKRPDNDTMFSIVNESETNFSETNFSEPKFGDGNEVENKTENEAGSEVGDNMSVEEIYPTSFTAPSESKPKFKSSEKIKQRPFNQSFSSFMNPAKADIPPPTQEGGGESDSEEESEGSISDIGSDSASEASEDPRSSFSKPTFPKSNFSNPTLDRKQKKKEYYEKKSLLNELKELEKEGYKLYDSYNIKNDIDDIRHEVDLGHRYFNIIRGQQQIVGMLFTFVRFVEKAVGNIPKQWNPLNVSLNGLYDGLAHERKSIEYDIKRILKKYTGSDGEVFSPEVSLLCTLTFVVAQTIIMNYGGQFLMKQAERYEEKHPGFMDSIMSGMQTVMGMAKNFDMSNLGNMDSMMPPPSVNMNAPFNNNPAPFTPAPTPNTVPQNNAPRVMQPPQTNLDIKNLFPQNNTGNVPMNQTGAANNFTRPQQTRDPTSVNNSSPVVNMGPSKVSNDDVDRFSELSSVVSSGSEQTEKSKSSVNSRGRKGKNSLDIF